MKQKILFLAPVVDFKGGAERSLFDLMKNPSITPVLAVPGPGPLQVEAQRLGIATEVVDFGSIAQIRRPFRVRDGLAAISDVARAVKRIKAICREHRIDAMHSNGLKAHALGVLARRFGARPVAVHIRDIANTTIEKFVWRFLALLADRTVLVSRACWPFAGDMPKSVCVIHNGFRDVSASTVHRWAEKPSLTLGFIGRLHPHKGLHILLSALHEARLAGANFNLIVRGQFDKELPDYQRQIEDQIARLGLDTVAFEGFVSEPAKVYEGIDIVCVPSTLPDPLPRSVMEAMGRGLPVIAAPCGGIPEMFEHGKSGFLAGEPEDIAACLMQLYRDRALMERIGAQAQKRAAEAFTLEQLYDNINQVYQSMEGRPVVQVVHAE